MAISHFLFTRTLGVALSSKIVTCPKLPSKLPSWNEIWTQALHTSAKVCLVHYTVVFWDCHSEIPRQKKTMAGASQDMSKIRARLCLVMPFLSLNWSRSITRKGRSWTGVYQGTVALQVAMMSYNMMTSHDVTSKGGGVHSQKWLWWNT